MKLGLTLRLWWYHLVKFSQVSMSLVWWPNSQTRVQYTTVGCMSTRAVPVICNKIRVDAKQNADCQSAYQEYNAKSTSIPPSSILWCSWDKIRNYNVASLLRSHAAKFSFPLAKRKKYLFNLLLQTGITKISSFLNHFMTHFYRVILHSSLRP